MSFTSTPLGSNLNRRVDHNTFFNKPPLPSHAPPIPTSYSFSGPPSLTLSPPGKKPHDLDNPDEPALVRFAKQKQRANNSTLDPQNWAVKDTSVQIANAFHQAATVDNSSLMPPSNPNDSWGSSASQRKSNLPRSTSVEYEKESQSTTIRRLNPPPRIPPRKTVLKSASIQLVPDSEDDEYPPATHVTGKSPFEQVADVVRPIFKPATFFMIRRSQEPEDLNGRDGSSYDYLQEEQEFQQQQQQQNPQENPPLSKRSLHKRGRISVDNKAYRPTASDLELSDEDFDDDKKVRRRKKNKKDAVGGPLTSLPVASYDKRRKRKKNTKGGEEDEQDEDEDSGTDEQEKISDHRVSDQRASVPRSAASQPHRTSISRDSIPPDRYEQADTSMDVEQGLDSIPEVDESFDTYDQRSSQTPASFSIGGFLGRIVNFIIRTIVTLFSSFFWLLGYITWLFGQLLGVVIKKPTGLLKSINFAALAKLAILAFGGYFIWQSFQAELFRIPNISWPSSSHIPYQPPSIPASDIAELSARLQTLESALSSLSRDSERTRVQLKDEINKGKSDYVGRLGLLESKVQSESSKVLEAESQLRQFTSQGLKSVKQEIEALQSQIASSQSYEGDSEGNDEEAREKLKVLEERLGSVEGGMKEALELGKNAIKVGTAAGSAAWWNKLSSGSSASTLMIKSSDGQDVTKLIAHLVDSATSKITKDIVARPDFALNSGGATVIPSLTSPTYEIWPVGVANQVLGFVTGSGNAIGRPPVTALHHEINNGYCWPFPGNHGQLGVKLALPVLISDITIDHVAQEVAFDLRPAPREMELWGLVEGKDNLFKLKNWLAQKQMRREEALAAGETVKPEDEEWMYPQGLPRNVQYARIASFTYDIHAPTNIQTFPVSQDIKDLGIDFGLVVLFVKNNWGREEFTCLYRFRVYGEQAVESPPPHDLESLDP